ncbi:hypothetical protein [Roseivirga spongicola]|uniref:Card1 CARF domain-containing protein n=1 Tax=Roseivirga spongicola TaxID=333140 RepID=A0A150X257_9BACT|nr:hypothetical protein [Roseivirga spongicola]KYG72662.1 hypothetical protein AWW68_17350 [Roseivirga spongicola]WPZ10264.1 hypothetical protein T7867_18530 [Roseivirga spongicola]
MNEIRYTENWIQLSRSGEFEEAQELYFSKLLPEIIESFQNRFQDSFNNEDMLISILGFSPEPIILTAKAMKPSKHVIVTTGENKAVEEVLQKYLEDGYSIIRLNDESFLEMYKALKEQLILNNHSKIVVDITGGKKSMVASASIFAKDYACKIVYVDFTEYLQELRKPKPGTEVLNIVYNPNTDQPEIKLSE